MNTAVILAAGGGKKIWPYSEYRPKAGLPVGGVPNIIRQVKQLKKLKINNIIVVVSYLEKQFRYLLREEKKINIISIADPQGTGDSLEKVIDLINDRHVLVMYGDIVCTDRLLKQLINSYHTGSYDGVVLANPLENERSQDWFCVQTNHDGQVLQVYGHPRSHYVDHQLMGVYGLHTEDLRTVIKSNPGIMLNVNVGSMPHPEAELEQSIQLLIEKGKIIQMISSENEAIDMDKPWHILEANRLITEQEVSTLTDSTISPTANIHPSAEISGHMVVGNDVTIGRNVVMEGNVIIGDRTVIENGAIIGANTIIGNDTSLTDYCKIGEHSVIGHQNRFGHCAEFQGVTFDMVSFVHFGEVYGVIGAYTDIAAGVTAGTLRFDDLNQLHEINGRREEPENFSTAAFIGDYTRTGINNLLMPGVKIGANCAIGPGVMVNKDVPSKTLLYVEQNIVKKDWGPERYGW